MTIDSGIHAIANSAALLGGVLAIVWRIRQFGVEKVKSESRMTGIEKDIEFVKANVAVHTTHDKELFAEIKEVRKDISEVQSSLATIEAKLD